MGCQSGPVSGDQRRLAAALFVVAWGTNVSTPLILRYQDRLGLTNTGAVGIFVIYVAGILLALLFAGRLSDRFGRRAVAVPSTALSACGSLILVFGRDSLATLFVGRFLLGAVSGAMLSVGTAWLSEVAHQRIVLLRNAEASATEQGVAATARLKLAGITTIVMYLGFGFGPITSALWDRFLPSPLIGPYVLHAAACAAVIVAMWTIAETKARDSTVSLRPQVGVPAPVRREFFGTLAPAAVWAFGFPSVSFALFPVILRDSIGGADVLLAGANGTLTAVVVLLSRPILDRVGDARRALPVAIWMGVAGYLIGIISFTTGAWWLVPFAAILMGSASGVIMSGGLAITEELSDETNRGAMSATFYLTAYAGMTMPIVITLIGGLTSTTIGLGVVTAVATVAGVIVTARSRTLAIA